jgi:excinuclease ABC subunit C
MSPDLPLKIDQFPQSPGVYLMKNEKGECLYVGKAKNLRSRVLSYFSEDKDGRYQIQFLMRKVSEIEPIVTKNEKEALLLEDTLIKKYRPRYNILFRDDKSYLSLKLNVQHPFPRLLITRKIEKDGSLYFGPYPSGFKAREVVDFIDQYFRLRNCSERDFSNRVRPCLQYQIKRCDAPCVGYIFPEAYGEIVRQVKLFLQGRNQELVETLHQKMEEASNVLQFEEAVRYRDLLHAIEKTLEKQQVVSYFAPDQDTLGLYREGERVSLVILIFRGGKLSETKHYYLNSHQDFSEILENFLLQYYSEDSLIPKEILIPHSVEDLEVIQEILADRKGQMVSVKVPEKGDKRARVELANQNAEEKFKHEALTQQGREEILSRLQSRLHLSKLPRRIECYDISNIQGQMAVGSCVSFFEGEPDKSAYRRFKIKTVAQANDFAMLYEVLSRRFGREGWPLPDLIVIDGGKGQLHAAQVALKEKNVLNVDLVALAKEKRKEGREEKPERVFLLGRKNPVILKPNSSELHLLVRLRDEAHRFGITFHRKLRGRQTLHSKLDFIPGVGTTRKKELLKTFGSVKRLSEASLEEIARVKGINRSVASKVYEFLHRL